MLHATTSLPDSISDNLPNPKIKQGKSLFYNSMLLQFVVVIVVNRYQSMFADWMNESLFVLLSFLMTRPIRSDMTLSTARGWNLKIVTNLFNTRFSKSKKKTKQNEAEKSLFIFLLYHISSRIFPFLFLFPFLLLLLLFIIRYYLSIVFSCCCCSCC